MRRIICALVGHRWNWAAVRAVCHWSVNLTHLHPLAGCHADCLRCGFVWDDRCGACP